MEQSRAHVGEGVEQVVLGIRSNLSQFILLVAINAFVGGMVGLERSILPIIAEEEFALVASAAVLSFIVVFGITKALTNYVAGRLADRLGRKPVLVAGWLVALPVPLLLAWAPSWGWVIAANVLLGISQGLTWSTTVIMKIDLAGPKQRGLAMGLNEFAGYLAVAGSAWATASLAAHYGPRPEPFYLGIVFVVIGTVLSIVWAKETRAFAAADVAKDDEVSANLSQREVLIETSWRNPALSSASQAGLVNNLNDGMAWGLLPIVFLANGMTLSQIGIAAAIYPGVWGIGQLLTGALSDRWSRKKFIVLGMLVQAVGIAVTAFASTFPQFAFAMALMGAGTAMVYPTLLATVADASHSNWRASAVGIYRLWRDSGYAVGALSAGLVADWFGIEAAILSVAALTFASGLLVQGRMPADRSVERSPVESSHPS